ncbi:MAG: hypothetical protein LLG01_14050 [Planctomycetaceae bacterium]|nr:hypothetical protein [Planctomycetaceae bacterium]
MSSFKEMTGDRYGRLVVIEKSHRAGPKKSWYWRCKCDCGAEHIASGSGLRQGSIRSCGCLKEDIGLTLAGGEGMVGKRFGFLVVLNKVESKGSAYWACQCDCGKVHVARGTALRHGHTKSCGCMRGKTMIHDGPKTSVKVGDVYGLLTVVNQLESTSQGSRWQCVCKCGGMVEARGKDLRGGNTSSCGCSKLWFLKTAGGRVRKAAEELCP